MKLPAIVVAFGLVAACGKSPAVKEVESLADEMCECKDIRCAAEVTRKAADLMKRYASETANESSVKAIEAAGERMRRCAQRVGR